LADSVVHIGENSPEEVALKLMRLIGAVEKREEYGHGDHPMDREWILRTYNQCISLVTRNANIEDILKRFAPGTPHR
jgi:hypothetical protein